MKRPVLYIILGVLFVGGILISLLLRRPKTTVVTTPQTSPGELSLLNRLPALPITPLPNSNESVQFYISMRQPQFPVTASVYAVTANKNPLTVGEAIAREMGLSGSPEETGGSTKKYSWTGPQDTSVIVDILPPNVSLIATIPLTPGVPTKIAGQQRILSFLREKQILSEGIDLRLTSNRLLKANGLNVTSATDSTANLINLNFQYVINGLPLYQNTGVATSVSSLLGHEGAIRSLSVVLPPVLGTKKEVSLIPVDAAAALLRQNKGLLIAAEKTKFSEASSDTTISQVTINSVQLGYYYDENLGRLEPVYAFEGKVTKGSAQAKNAIVTYVVPAALK